MELMRLLGVSITGDTEHATRAQRAVVIYSPMSTVCSHLSETIATAHLFMFVSCIRNRRGLVLD